MKQFYHLAIFCFFFSAAAHAETMTGNEFLEKMANKDSNALYYLVGIVDAAEASRLVFDQNLMKIDASARENAINALGQYWGCRPEKVSYGQVGDVTVAYINTHPKIRHLDLGMIIAAAIRDAWPCEKR